MAVDHLMFISSCIHPSTSLFFSSQAEFINPPQCLENLLRSDFASGQDATSVRHTLTPSPTPPSPAPVRQTATPNRKMPEEVALVAPNVNKDASNATKHSPCASVARNEAHSANRPLV